MYLSTWPIQINSRLKGFGSRGRESPFCAPFRRERLALAQARGGGTRAGPQSADLCGRDLPDFTAPQLIRDANICTVGVSSSAEQRSDLFPPAFITFAPRSVRAEPCPRRGAAARTSRPASSPALPRRGSALRGKCPRRLRPDAGRAPQIASGGGPAGARRTFRSHLAASEAFQRSGEAALSTLPFYTAPDGYARGDEGTFLEHGRGAASPAPLPVRGSCSPLAALFSSRPHRAVSTPVAASRPLGEPGAAASAHLPGGQRERREPDGLGLCPVPAEPPSRCLPRDSAAKRKCAERDAGLLPPREERGSVGARERDGDTGRASRRDTSRWLLLESS